MCCLAPGAGRCRLLHDTPRVTATDQRAGSNDGRLGGEVVRIEAKRCHRRRVELPSCLQTTPLLEALDGGLHGWTPEAIDLSGVEAELPKTALDCAHDLWRQRLRNGDRRGGVGTPAGATASSSPGLRPKGRNRRLVELPHDLQPVAALEPLQGSCAVPTPHSVRAARGRRPA